MTDLPLLDDSELSRILCIVAHPDDMEYGASAAVAKWTGEGKTVAYLLLTHGEAGIRNLPPVEVGPLRAEEQANACRIVGVDVGSRFSCRNLNFVSVACRSSQFHVGARKLEA
ncbi:PIG-L deacetylase family protein, partial [Brevibacterium casei]|uniref:PIG-L deacetylase family protein n=1 Tax=Brevibacterium casei TaxID=33889 RepID=UPI0039EF4C98